MSSDPTFRLGGVPEHFNLPWELTVDDLSEPLGLRWRAFPDGSGAMARALAAGEIDVAIMLTTSTLKAIAGGLDAAINGTHVPSPLRWGIHVAAHSDAHEVADIRGRTIAISRPGSGSHLVPIVDALERGWPLDEQTFAEVGTIDGAREALTSGEAEVFFWEQFMTQPLVTEGVFRRVGVRLPPWPSFLLVARRSWLDEAPPLDEAIDRAAAHCEALSSDPRGTSARLSDRFGITKTQALEWLSLTDWRCEAGVSGEALSRATHYLSRAFDMVLPPAEEIVSRDCQIH